MAKYWEPGRVKTRLGASVGMDRAAELHRIFVLHLCEVLAEVDAAKQVVVAPDEKLADVAAALSPSWSVAGQGSGDLGQRMARWFQGQLGPRREEDAPPEPPPQPRAMSPRAMLIGGDCLTVGPTEIAEAFEKLADHDVVIGPSADGGYYLIGIAGRWNPARGSLFENVSWGTDRVAEITRRRVESAKLSAAELAPMEDVDTIDELDRLRETLASRPTDRSRPDHLENLRRSIDATLASPSSGAATPPPETRDPETS